MREISLTHIIQTAKEEKINERTILKQIISGGFQFLYPVLITIFVISYAGSAMAGILFLHSKSDRIRCKKTTGYAIMPIE